RLAGRIYAFLELAHARRVGSHRDDGAGLAGDHVVKHRTRTVDHAPEVDLDLLLPLLAILVDEKPFDGPADIVDEDVYRAEFLLRPLDHGGDGVDVRDVGPLRDATLRADLQRLPGHFLGLFLVDVGDDDVGAFLR